MSRTNGSNPSVEAEPTESAETVKNKKAQGAFIKPTAQEEAAVIRKLDYRLLPLVLILYTFSVLDRSTIGISRLSGMEDDIDLFGSRYK